ncbi:MAG: DUF123 domain-containing protein [Candidatus Glassbacteria bacterium]|nr:DUF123 domain-containing protein [Candidatus Glassbacteria bacterium]
MGGLAARLNRHLYGPSSGKLHWHIDYLASCATAKEFMAAPAGAVTECSLSEAAGALPGAGVPAAGFGSSDCPCRSHLHFLPSPAWPDIDGLVAWVPPGEG